MKLNIHQNIQEKLEYFQSIHKIPNIIFHGPSGSGKRTIVSEFIHNVYNNDRDKIKALVMYGLHRYFEPRVLILSANAVRNDY